MRPQVPQVPQVTNAELCVYQINRFHRAEDRAVLITDRHLYKMDPLKQYKPMKTLPLYNVGTLRLSDSILFANTGC